MRVRVAGEQAQGMAPRPPAARSNVVTDWPVALARSNCCPSVENASADEELIVSSAAATDWDATLPVKLRNKIRPAPVRSTTAASCPDGAKATKAGPAVAVSMPR